VFLLLVGSSVSVLSFPVARKGAFTGGGVTRYVGGQGPGNFSKIQDAVNASSPGDTVFVYAGKYAEHVIINVQNFSLKGEGKESTFIGFDWTDHHVVDIFQSGVMLSGFSIKAGSVRFSPVHLNLGVSDITITNTSLMDGLSGVYCDGQNRNLVFNDNGFARNRCSINTRNDEGSPSQYIFQRNVFYGGMYGIALTGDSCEASNNSFIDVSTAIAQASSNAVITYNSIIGSNVGISVEGTSATITRDSFSKNGYGIALQNSNTTISDCQFERDSTGISLLNNYHLLIERCSFTKESLGIYLVQSDNNEIHACSFHGNSRGVIIENSNAVITSCNFSSNEDGLHIYYSHAQITRNNFINDTIHFNLTSIAKPFVRVFNNYYGKSTIMIKIIPGSIQTIFSYLVIGSYYWTWVSIYRPGFLVDWHPRPIPILSS
jgi:parallel beta-helix repeat protein